jgi:hypothetical protein
MVSLSYFWNHILETYTNPQGELLANAAYHARDAQAHCVDVAAMLFPTGHIIPSDALISDVSAKVRGLILGIQKVLLPNIFDYPEMITSCWQLLVRSGFLREATLVDFILARNAEQTLSKKIACNGQVSTAEQMPAALLGNADPNIAEAAQILVAADGLRQHSTSTLYHELGAELLHQTVWRVVAALQMITDRRDANVIDAAKNLLTRHDEGQIARVAARKLVHFLGVDNIALLSSPEAAGLDLYVASLAVDIGVDHDHVLRLIAAHSSAPLATMLRARDAGREEAMATICLFKGFNLTPREVTNFDAGYDVLDYEAARREIEQWAIERSQFLAFLK